MKCNWCQQKKGSKEKGNNRPYTISLSHQCLLSLTAEEAEDKNIFPSFCLHLAYSWDLQRTIPTWKQGRYEEVIMYSSLIIDMASTTYDVYSNSWRGRPTAKLEPIYNERLVVSIFKIFKKNFRNHSTPSSIFSLSMYVCMCVCMYVWMFLCDRYNLYEIVSPVGGKWQSNTNT